LKRGLEEKRDPYEETLKHVPPWMRIIWEMMKKAEREIEAQRAKEKMKGEG